MTIKETEAPGQPGYVNLTLDIDRSGKTKVRKVNIESVHYRIARGFIDAP